MKTTVKKIKTATRYKLEIELDDSDDNVELELTHEPDCNFEPIVTKVKDGWVVGYLVRDENCENPLESCDAMGAIYSSHRNAGQASHQGFQEARGLNRYWERSGKPNPFAIPLDCYDHGGQTWAISKSLKAMRFPDQQWDVAHGAGVWVPGKSDLDNIWYNTAQKILPEGTILGWTPYISGKKQRVFVKLAQRPRKFYFASFKTALEALLRRAFQKQLILHYSREQVQEQFKEELHKYAESCVEAYNSWLSGDCWGVCVDTVNEAGEITNNDSCWEYVGDKHAQESLKEQVDYAVEKANEALQVQETVEA